MLQVVLGARSGTQAKGKRQQGSMSSVNLLLQLLMQLLHLVLTAHVYSICC